MTEDEARGWVRKRFGVSRETSLEAFGALLKAEAPHQNLVAASTLDQLWARHLVDSAQLVPLAEAHGGDWIDIGSGAGLPGIVVALLTDRRVILVEPRAKRVEFLRGASERLGISDRVEVIGSKIGRYQPERIAAVISARAVAELGALLDGARHCTDLSTIWLLPKGRNAQSEVAAARRAWQGVFHVEPSVTSPDSGIVVARRIAPR